MIWHGRLCAPHQHPFYHVSHPWRQTWLTVLLPLLAFYKTCRCYQRSACLRCRSRQACCCRQRLCSSRTTGRCSLSARASSRHWQQKALQQVLQAVLVQLALQAQRQRQQWQQQIWMRMSWRVRAGVMSWILEREARRERRMPLAVSGWLLLLWQTQHCGCALRAMQMHAQLSWEACAAFSDGGVPSQRNYLSMQ